MRHALPALLLAATGGAFFLASGAVAGAAPGGVELGASGLLSATGLALLALAGALLAPAGVRAALGLAPGRAGAGTVVLLAVGVVGVCHLLDAAIRGLDLADQGSLAWLDQALARSEGWGLVAACAGVALAPGVGEELLFRGLLLRAFSAKLGLPAGVALSSLLFGAAHLDPVQGSAAAVLGVYLALVAAACGSTWPAIACHVLNNLVVVAGAALGAGAGEAAGALTPVAVVATGAGLAALVRLRRRGRDAAGVGPWEP
jgi:membrane protease YdiL (CAAX protease family)